MLKCREVAELANDYIDQELQWHKTMAMGFHLAMCKHCSGFVQKLRLVINLVNEQPPEILSDENAENIVKTVLRKKNGSAHKED